MLRLAFGFLVLAGCAAKQPAPASSAEPPSEPSQDDDDDDWISPDYQCTSDCLDSCTEAQDDGTQPIEEVNASCATACNCEPDYGDYGDD